MLKYNNKNDNNDNNNNNNNNSNNNNNNTNSNSNSNSHTNKLQSNRIYNTAPSKSIYMYCICLAQISNYVIMKNLGPG